MFSYYGSKSKLIRYYPRPLYDKIIEPFAGSARYSLMYYQKEITLIDKSKIICDIWNYLKQCDKCDIEKLPILGRGEDLRKINYLTNIEKMLLGFIIGQGVSRPANIVTPLSRKELMRQQLRYIANQLFKIKHWCIINDTYENVENKDATWFIDPPYQYGGHAYMESNKKINFDHLSEWCRSRNGQVIVCENTKADWLPFQPIKSIVGTIGLKTTEAIWTKESSKNAIYKQNNLFDL